MINSRASLWLAVMGGIASIAISVPAARLLFQSHPAPTAATAPLDVTEVFAPSGWMGERDSLSADFKSHEELRPGSDRDTTAKFSYRPGPTGWAGIAWQYPADNWGSKPGLRIREASAVTFWARGARGGEAVEFRFGGASNPLQPYRDSAEKSLGITILSTEWKRFTLDLTGLDLDNVIVGFMWTASSKTNPDGLTFYLDTIKIE